MNNIAANRKKAGLSQSRLCKKLGWTQSRLGNYERGIRVPGLAECRLLVDAFASFDHQVTLDELFPPEASPIGSTKAA